MTVMSALLPQCCRTWRPSGAISCHALDSSLAAPCWIHSQICGIRWLEDMYRRTAYLQSQLQQPPPLPPPRRNRRTVHSLAGLDMHNDTAVHDNSDIHSASAEGASSSWSFLYSAQHQPCMKWVVVWLYLPFAGTLVDSAAWSALGWTAAAAASPLYVAAACQCVPRIEKRFKRCAGDSG